MQRWRVRRAVRRRTNRSNGPWSSWQTDSGWRSQVGILSFVCIWRVSRVLLIACFNSLLRTPTHVLAYCRGASSGAASPRRGPAASPGGGGGTGKRSGTGARSRGGGGSRCWDERCRREAAVGGAVGPRDERHVGGGPAALPRAGSLKGGGGSGGAAGGIYVCLRMFSRPGKAHAFVFFSSSRSLAQRKREKKIMQVLGSPPFGNSPPIAQVRRVAGVAYPPYSVSSPRVPLAGNVGSTAMLRSCGFWVLTSFRLAGCQCLFFATES